jgi:hypothetical protein
MANSRSAENPNEPTAQNPSAEGRRACDAAAREPKDDVGIVPWLVVVVRAWTHEDRRIVRMALSGNGCPPVVCYEPSSVAAGERLAGWLDELPAPQPADWPACDAGGDEPETLQRRADGAAVPSVSDGPQREDEET